MTNITYLVTSEIDNMVVTQAIVSLLLWLYKPLSNVVLVVCVTDISLAFYKTGSICCK